MSDFEFKHRFKHPITQVEFSDWADKTAPRDYWRDVGALARLVGSSLNSQDHPTTILVRQSKEKFGQVRVYCSLAFHDLVKQRWEGQRGFVLGSEPTEDFINERILEDAIHYRWTYMSLVRLVPHYHNVLIHAADWPGLLCQTIEERDELMASPYDSSCGFDYQSPTGKKMLDKIYEK